MLRPTDRSLARSSRQLLRAAPVALCWTCLAASVLGYIYVSAVVLRQPFHVGIRRLDYFDLRVYRGAGWRVLHNRPLYARPIRGPLGFTYPPFAALLFIPLSLLPLGSSEHLMLLVNVAGVVLMLRCAVILASRSGGRLEDLGRRPGTAWAVAVFAGGALLWLEPVTTALGYGQVDVIVALLVIYDLTRADRKRSKGAAIGIAAAIKLTPLLFLTYLFLCGRRRAAATGAAVFAATVALGFILAGGDSASYWGGLFLHSSRVGPAADPGNQSLRAAIARLAGTEHPGAMTLLTMVLVGLGGLLLAVRADRRGNLAAGFSLCAVTELLVAPVTWTHHWTLVVPALLALALLAYDRRSPALALALIALLAVGYGYLPERVTIRPVSIGGGIGTLVADPYVLAGLAVLAAAALMELGTGSSQPDSRPYPEEAAADALA